MVHMTMLFWTLLVLCLSVRLAAEVRPKGQPVLNSNGVASCAKPNENYCENLAPYEKYPEKAILTYFKRLNKLPHEILNYIFKVAVDDLKPTTTHTEYVDASNSDFKKGNESNVQLCSQDRNTIAPLVVKTTNNEWRYIVNNITLTKDHFPQLKSNETYELRFEVETCRDGSRLCQKMGFKKMNYSCQQGYVTMKLLALNLKGTSVEPVQFHSPSCCQCAPCLGSQCATNQLDRN